jgi:tungstate transport system substrate-binding protein
LTFSTTWVAGKKDLTNLTILFKGDPFLINTYHALCQPEGRGKNAAIASKFIDFVGSEQGQRIIRDYGKDLYGETMYNDAEYASQYAH